MQVLRNALRSLPCKFWVPAWAEHFFNLANRATFSSGVFLILVDLFDLRDLALCAFLAFLFKLAASAARLATQFFSGCAGNAPLKKNKVRTGREAAVGS